MEASFPLTHRCANSGVYKSVMHVEVGASLGTGGATGLSKDGNLQVCGTEGKCRAMFDRQVLMNGLL